MCTAAASVRPSPTHPALAADTQWLCWLLVAFAGEDQRVHSRTSKLFKAYYPIRLCYSGLGNTTAFPYAAQQMQTQEFERSFKPLL